MFSYYLKLPHSRLHVGTRHKQLLSVGSNVIADLVDKYNEWIRLENPQFLSDNLVVRGWESSEHAIYHQRCMY